MKRRILAMLLVVVIAVAALSGCGLVTKNDTKASEQAVISVGNGVYKDSVTKQNIIDLFYSYGWYYVYYYSMSVSDVVDLLLDNSLTTKIMTYSATENLPVVNNISKITDENKYDVYFTSSELNDIAAKLDAYISTQIDAKEKEIIQETAKTNGLTLPSDDDIRTTPTGYSFVTSVPVDYIGTDTRAQAAAKFKRLLLSENKLTFDQYYAKMLLIYKKDALLSKYVEKIKGEVNASDAEVEARYNEILAQEKEKYAINISAYKSKLSAIQSAKEFSGSNFVLYSPVEGYGLALNLLVKFNEEQAAKITEWKAEVTAGTMTKEQYLSKRDELLNELVVSDERSSWLKNYGYDSSLFDDNAFDGTVKPSLSNNIQNKDELGLFKYEELTANKYTFTEFLSKVNGVMGGVSAGQIDGYDIYKSSLSKKEDFLKLIWAYGEDSGSFNSSVGYVCYPNTADSGYAEEYAAATKALVGAGEGSYVVVATDFGYHIVFLIEAYDKVGITNVFNSSEKDTEGTFSNLFFNSVNNTLKENYYNEKVSSIAAGLMADKNFTKTDEKAKAELVDGLTAAMGN